MSDRPKHTTDPTIIAAANDNAVALIIEYEVVPTTGGYKGLHEALHEAFLRGYDCCRYGPMAPPASGTGPPAATDGPNRV